MMRQFKQERGFRKNSTEGGHSGTLGLGDRWKRGRQWRGSGGEMRMKSQNRREESVQRVRSDRVKSNMEASRSINRNRRQNLIFAHEHSRSSCGDMRSEGTVYWSLR